jgi:serine O-acetyltransferase
MKSTILKDLYRYGGETSILRGLRKEGFCYTYFLRKASVYKRSSPLGIIFRVILKRLSYKYGFQIPASTCISSGLYINHYGPLVINEGAIIGKNFTVSHSVTIGQANRGKRKGSPIIKDNVFVGVGSVIVGKINIGNNVLIAPNSYVNTDVPDNSMVMGNPITITSNENATYGYINFTND